MKKLKIGFIQMRCEKGAIAQNMEVMEKYISKCHENNVDIVCFPEMNITGYNDPNRYADAVLTLDHHSIKKVIELSNTYSICIVAGFIEYNPNGKPFISISICETVGDETDGDGSCLSHFLFQKFIIRVLTNTVYRCKLKS